MRDVRCEDIRVEELQDDFLIDLHPLGGAAGAVIDGITFRNIQQTGGQRRPSRIDGRKDLPVKNITVENLRILGKPVTTAADGEVQSNEHATNISITAGR